MTDSEKNVTISQSAVKRVRELTADGEFAGMNLRIAVNGGGCSGFQYSFSFDDTKNGDDRVIERDGVEVLIDEVTWDFIAGSELHFAEELIGSYFTLQNPNAASTCGCGVSFSIG
tara:strand:+ start:810 stop:1154 length:345 start_codon:yes stop_codon:yes gene_type:complete